MTKEMGIQKTASGDPARSNNGAIYHDWDKLRLEYLHENLRQDQTGPLTLAELSKRHHVSYGRTRNVAAKQRWNKQLGEMVGKRDAQATKAVHDVSLTNEVEVRLRQAKLSRLAIDKAIAKIALLEPEELSIKDAVALLRLGLEQERKALGMADVITTPLLDDRKSPDEISAVQQAMAIIGSLRVLGGRGVTNP